MPIEKGCTLCGGNDHERSSCSWSDKSPSEPGAYYVKGFRLGEDDYRPALVDVARDEDGELVCNIHLSNSDDELFNWSFVADCSERFLWLGPLRSQSAPAGEREAFRAWQTEDGWKRPDDPGELEAFQAGAAWQRTQAAGVPDVSAMARVLSDRSADACNIDRTDNWAMYGQEYIEDVQAMLAAPAQPAAQDQGEVQRLPSGWRVFLTTSSVVRDGDRWEVYGPNGGGVVSTHDVKDWTVRELLDALAASTGQGVKS